MGDGPQSGEAERLRFEQVTLLGQGGSPILDSVTGDVPLGGITVLVGPSGAGKTSLLRLCNRLEVPTSGRVLLGGHNVASIDPLALRRRVGMVFQRPTLFGGAVRDDLLVARRDADDALLVEVLGRAGLDPEFLERPGDELSGGEAQRVCIARALLTQPEVLLMDEPTSSLDPENRAFIEQLAWELADNGLAVLWVTHDLQQARRLSDHPIVLMAGRLATEAEAVAFLGVDQIGPGPQPRPAKEH